MIVDTTSVIDITLYYRSGRGVRVESEEGKIPKSRRSEYTAISFKMRNMTWQMSNDLMRSCRHKDLKTGIDEIDWIVYKEKKLQAIIIGWDYKDKSGKDVPVTNNSIMNLHPLVAETLLSAYDKKVYLEEDERKDLVMEVDAYIKASSKGSKHVIPPSEIIELSLFEKFHWTPTEVDNIPLKRLQRLFVVLNQRDNSSDEAQEQAAKARAEKRKQKQ